MIDFKNILHETINSFLNQKIFYHGSTDKNLEGKKGIHVGTKLAATEAASFTGRVYSKRAQENRKKRKLELEINKKI